jgi:TRAP-type C4-dicarboxylate transport system permease small subunit
MCLEKAADAIYKVMAPLSKALVFIGGACLAAMMCLTASDVALRYFFNKPISGAFDLTEYMMVIVFAFGLPYCTLRASHIKVDILMERLPVKAQAIITSIITPLGLCLFSLIAWQSIKYLQIQHNTHIVSSVLLIPRYPFIGLLFLGYACFAVVLLANTLKYIAKVIRK